MTLREKLTDRGWVECGTCGGEGGTDACEIEGCPCGVVDPCPDCCGGLVPPDDQVEAAAAAWIGVPVGHIAIEDTHRRRGRVALVAAARKEPK